MVLGATIALPLALPTLFELPIALALVGAGLHGAAAVPLFAGPALNLPSLFTVARAASWRLAAAVAVAVWRVAVAGGALLVALLSPQFSARRGREPVTVTCTATQTPTGKRSRGTAMEAGEP